jgi:hypothetical protein
MRGTSETRKVQIYISEAIARKLRERHNVSEAEVVQCFRNKVGKFATDIRLEHRTDKPTLWFIAETDNRRRLKVVFVRYSKDEYIIKSAFDPNADEERLYEKYLKRG